MRGAPHKGLARDICRMRWMVSGAKLLRPVFLARLFQRQKRRKPWRCQWSTVSGRTSRIACVHRFQTVESQTQRTRSTGCNRGRLVFRLRTRSWWRSAAFSSSKWRRDFNSPTASRSQKFNQPNMPRKIAKIPSKPRFCWPGSNYCQPQGKLNRKSNDGASEMNHLS